MPLVIARQAGDTPIRPLGCHDVGCLSKRFGSIRAGSEDERDQPYGRKVTLVVF